MNRSLVNFEAKMNILERYINNGHKIVKEWAWAALVPMASIYESNPEKVREAIFDHDTIVGMPEEAIFQRKFFRPDIKFIKFMEPKPSNTATPSMDSNIAQKLYTESRLGKGFQYQLEIGHCYKYEEQGRTLQTIFEKESTDNGPQPMDCSGCEVEAIPPSKDEDQHHEIAQAFLELDDLVQSFASMRLYSPVKTKRKKKTKASKAKKNNLFNADSIAFRVMSRSRNWLKMTRSGRNY